MGARRLITLLYLLFGVNAIFLRTVEWAMFWCSTLLGQFLLVSWLRQFNLAEHERSSLGLTGQVLFSRGCPGTC